MANVAQCTQNSRVASAGIFLRDAQDQCDDFVLGSRPTGLTLFHVIAFLCNQFSVPTQQRVRRDQGIELSENLTAKRLGSKR